MVARSRHSSKFWRGLVCQSNLPLSSHLKEKGFICIEVPVIEGGISVSVQNSEYIGFLAERVMWVRINISD